MAKRTYLDFDWGKLERQSDKDLPPPRGAVTDRGFDFEPLTELKPGEIVEITHLLDKRKPAAVAGTINAKLKGTGVKAVQRGERLFLHRPKR